MIIDEATRIRRNKQLRRDLKRQAAELEQTKNHANGIIKFLRKKYYKTGQTTDIEILACDYPSMKLDNVMAYIANMGFITYTQRGDAYYVTFVLPEAEKPNTTKPPKAEPVKKESAKPPKPKIDDVEPKIEDIWPD